MWWLFREENIMKINVQSEIARALNKEIDKKIENDDETITYQEFFLFWVLRACSSSYEIDVDEKIKDAKKDGWIDQQWLESKASKYNDIITPVPWDKVYDW